MRYRPLIVLGLLCLPPAILSAGRDKDECESVKEKNCMIQANVRRGYAAEQGVTLNAKLLKLRKRRSKVCR